MAKKRRKKVVEEDEIAVVPTLDEFDDETFLKHFNARHRRTDTPGFVIDIPYSRGVNFGYFRKYHERCHETEAESGLVNGQRVEYDHVHEEDE
jgi:hypothetical protein